MDFLLIVLAIAGLVVAGVMLVLASRATRMDRESDARVERLQAMAAGSVLFASEAPVESADEAPEAAPPVTFDTMATPYPFVMTIPAGAGRVPHSFDRTHRRSGT